MALIKLCWVVFLLTTISFIEAAQHCRCENGGECVYDNYRFKYCKCPKGYTGLFCSELIECSNSSPCQNGARCVSSHGKSQCVCVNGYTGPDCSINIDDCASNPCSAGSICHDRIGSFFCECSKGWTGLLCQLRDGCASNPCHPSATCYANPTNGSAMCSCPKGYKGDDCSIDINECEESGSPCEHGGTCVNTEGSFRCDCLPGFTGSRCEININECASNPCINEGTCLDEIGGFRCICAPGYTGTQCETDIDECVEKPCLNNGVCTNLINGYRCLCPNGFNGTKCEINENECANSPCLNGGQCIDGIAQYTCNCLPGYSGLNCEININECLSNPCANGGQCIDGINSYVCTCQPGFTGPNCQTDINECLSNPCYHGGVCHDLANGFKCECPLGTSGIRCEYNTNECWSNPCRNGALCHDKINGYDCECAPGFTGLNCEIDIDECASSPCANGGKCHDLPNGFKCTCPKGYYDARCMSDVNECDPNPCLNGAQCEDDVNKYICHCLPGYTGPRCELEVDACASSPCQHNGQCMNYMGNYKCVCPAGFTGKSCEINISDCNASLFGDCLLGYNVNPWVNCTHSTFCWKAFSDGVCNEVCNTKECLFDGMDCLNKQKNAGSNNRYIIDKDDKQNQDIRLNGKRRQCNPEFDSYCQRNYQNGYCDQGCNNEQCGWDGLDCLEVNQKNNVKQYNYAELPYVAKGSLLITLDVPFNKLTETNEIQNSQKTKADERPIHFILRVLSQIVGTTLRVKQDFNDGNLVLRPVKNDNGENLTEVEVIADNRMCEYDCFDSAMQIANYLAAFQARTNELSHQFGHNTKFSLKSIRAREEAESLVGQNYPKEKEATSIVSWISCCIVIIFIGVLLGVLITNNKKRVAHGITWFPEGFTLKSGASCRSISTYNAAGGEYSRNKPLSKLRGNLHKLDRKPDGQEMSKNWMGSENLKTIPENKDLNTISHVIYEEPKDPRPWSMQHYEAYGDGKNQSSNNNGSGIVMPLQMYPDLKQILHPGLMQPQNMVMQTKANTEPPTNGLLSPPLVGCPGGVDVTGPSGLTPLMVAAAFRGATPFCGVGGDETSTTTPVTETTQLLDNELMDTHNGPGSASSSNGTSGNSSSSMIDALISQGASVDKKMENTGETSLHLAARFCRADAVKRLLEAKADCNAQDFSGRTPLHTAIAADACGAFEILIRNRATQLNAKSNDGNTPLIIAVRNCADSMMNELLLAGADVNASDNAERSALHWAAMVSNLKALKALIEYGANKDAQDEKEQTPLFLAAREGAYECVKTLLQAGANKDITDHMDVSPRKIAETKGHKDILGLLDGNVPITITNNSNNQNLNTQNSSANNPTSPHIVSPKKSSNSTTGTNKRRKQTKAQQAQVQAENAQQQNKSNNQQNQQTLQHTHQNYNQAGQTVNQTSTNTLKKAKATSALNQQPPPLPPPRPQPAPVQIPINIQSKTQVVNIPQNQQGQMIQQNHIQNIPSPFDYMIHTPLTPTCNQQQINIPATINNMTNLNCPPINHVLLSPNNTVLMSPPHHASGPMHQTHHYLGNPPPYEDSINHSNQQQISNATYMVNNQINTNQWQYKPEPNYYTIFNNNQNMDASYLTPSPDSPSNWSATTSPASAGDWLELQTPQQQSQQQNQMTNQQIIQEQQVQINQLNQQIQTNQQDLQSNKQQQIINNQITHQKIQQQLIDQQQTSVQAHQEQQIHVQQQLNQQPPAYQASCNQNSNSLQPSSNNNRQPTTTQQSVFL